VLFRSASHRIIHAAETFSNQIKLVQQQALLESATYGIQVDTSRYYVLRFQPASGWQRRTNFLSRDTLFPEHTLMRLENNNKNQRPSIIVYSTGDMTPFRLTLGLNKKANIVSVAGLADGSINMEKH
jgi:hypothetical protein